MARSAPRTSSISLTPPGRLPALSVSARVLLFTVVVWVGLLAGAHGVLQRLFRPIFVEIESGLMVKDLERVEAAVAREAEQLEATARDYSSWEEMKGFVLATQAAEVPKALNPAILRTLDLDAIFVFDEIGRPKYSLLEKDKSRQETTKEFTARGFAAEFPVIASVRTQGAEGRTSRRGLVRFADDTLVFAAAAPILNEDADAKRAALGTVVMVRELDEDGAARLGEQVRLPLDLRAAEPAGPMPMASQAQPVVSGGEIHASAWLRDPFGRPIARFAVARPASILAQGEETLALAGIGSLVVLSLVLAALLFLLQWSIVKPLKVLTASMEHVRRTGDLQVRVHSTRRDEIGVLAHNFDRLLALLGERTRVLEEQARTDGLTKLLNRRTVMREVERLVADGSAVSVLLLDVDHFKRINDTVGHSVGDRVLRAVAETLRSAAQADGMLGRYGGEEFLVVLPGFDRSAAAALGERIRVALEVADIQGVDWPVTASIGVATFAGHTAHGLLATADLNLYRAKETGRNKVVADDIPMSRLPAASIPPPEPSLRSIRIIE